MASSSSSGAVKREIAKEVKKEITKEKKKYAKKKKQKSPKHSTKIKKEIKKEVRKEAKKNGREGPATKFSVRVTASLGYIDGARDQGPDLKMAVFLNPALCKSPGEDQNFGPLQTAASQFGLWKLSKVTIRATPLIGSSAVSGTIARLSVNTTQSPSTVTWGGLGARYHRDIPAGRTGSLVLSPRLTAGPRPGGWWLTDTNVEGNQSCGPVVELHVLGKTMSTYKNEAFEGQLFILELTGRWDFAEYANNPGLATLSRTTDDVSDLKILTDDKGELQLAVKETHAQRLFVLESFPAGSNATEGTGERIYQVINTGVSIASSVIPPPFGWLLKGGWWFVKQVLGKTHTSNGDAFNLFRVYPSLADAQNNRPAISTQANISHDIGGSRLEVNQLNTPNMGIATTSSLTTRSVPVQPTFPLAPEGLPTGGFYMLAQVKPQYQYTTNGKQRPVFNTWASIHFSGEKWIPASHFIIENVNSFQVASGKLLGWYNFPESASTAQLDSRAASTNARVTMQVKGHNVIQLGTAGSTTIYFHLIYWTSQSTATWAGIRDNASLELYDSTGETRQDYRIESKDWNIVQQPADSTIYQRWFLTAFLSNQRDLSAMSSHSLPAAPFNITSTGACNDILALMRCMLVTADFNDVIVRFNNPPVRLTKLQKLMKRLGLQPEELSSTDEEEESEDEGATDSDEDSVIFQSDNEID